MTKRTWPTGTPAHLRRPKPKAFHYTSDVWEIAQRGLQAGAIRKTVYRTDWDIYGRCEAPVTVLLSGRPYVDRDGVTTSTGMDLQVPCRKCAACLLARGRYWTRAAIAETNASIRTWFGTLTLAPEWQHYALSKARAHEARNGCDFEAFEPTEQFRLRVSVIGEELTKYMKRVRKESGVTLRYLLVAEHHKSGDPHFHMLLHEPSEGSARKRTLQGQWRWGFSQWKLADPNSAWYVCKYLTKSNAARVRASLRYGCTDNQYDLRS